MNTQGDDSFNDMGFENMTSEQAEKSDIGKKTLSLERALSQNSKKI
jgi:hypothetical protein